MTREELEAEVTRLRAALVEAGFEAQIVSDRQAEREHQHRADLTAIQQQTIDANRRTFDAQSGAQSAAQHHSRQMAGAAAELSASQDLVAELRFSQAALAASETRHRAIFDNAADLAMIVTDPSGIIVDWNTGAETIFGWTASKMRGWDAERIFTPEDRANDRIATEMAGALGDGDGFDIVFSDVVMPGMGGVELAKKLARDLPKMPVILASGYSHVLAQEGTEGVELLRKPYSAAQLSVPLQRRRLGLGST